MYKRQVTTLGRGGSDITAVAIAAQLGWPCEVYSTTDGLYTVDPAIYPKAKKLASITYEEMMELANLGADKLETRSVELAKKYGVDVYKRQDRWNRLPDRLLYR